VIGQTERGFLAVEIDRTRMRLAYHAKRDPAVVDEPQWDGKFPFQKPVSWPDQ